MKTLIIPALGLLFLTGCSTPYFSSTPPGEITVQLRGTPGLSVCGDYYVDGVKQNVHGQIPMNIRAVGRNFSCDFNKTSPGDLSLVLNHNCKSYGKAMAVTAAGGVKAELKDGESFVMSSLSGY
jgi:hypothetical protein